MIAAIVFIWLWLQLWQLLMLVLVAVVVAIGLEPIVEWPTRPRSPSMWSSPAVSSSAAP